LARHIEDRAGCARRVDRARSGFVQFLDPGCGWGNPCVRTLRQLGHVHAGHAIGVHLPVPGVDVDLRNRTVANDSSAALLERMRTNERFRQDLAEADVVTMLVPFDGWAVPWQTVAGVGGYDPADCGGDDGQQCLRDILTEYEANTEAIFTELMSLIDPSETLVRGMDAYLVHVGDFAAGGTLDEVAPYWVKAQQFVRDTAVSHGIPVARLLNAFNGPDGTNDPMASGLVSSDAIHPTADGASLITKLVSDLGYRLSNQAAQTDRD